MSDELSPEEIKELQQEWALEGDKNLALAVRRKVVIELIDWVINYIDWADNHLKRYGPRPDGLRGREFVDYHEWTGRRDILYSLRQQLEKQHAMLIDNREVQL